MVAKRADASRAASPSAARQLSCANAVEHLLEVGALLVEPRTEGGLHRVGVEERRALGRHAVLRQRRLERRQEVEQLARVGERRAAQLELELGTETSASAASSGGAGAPARVAASAARASVDATRRVRRSTAVTGLAR